MNKYLESLFRFDIIRLCKLLEISQYCIIGFILTLMCGNLLNIYVISEYNLENISTIELIFNILIELVIMVITVYYIKKLTDCFPYLFSFITNKYIPSFKNESTSGYIIGSSLILTITLNKLDKKINELDKRIKQKLKQN